MDGSWIDWIRQGMRAAALRPVRDLPAGPDPWAMLLIVGLASAIGVAAQRFAIEGPATFDFYTWLVRWAPDALLIFGVWLVLGWARASSRHGSPVAAWYLLLSVSALPITLVGTVIGTLDTRQYLPGGWFNWHSWAAFVVLSAWFALVTWRISQAVNRS